MRFVLVVLWKQACDHVMDIPSPSPSKRKPSFLRKSSIYDDTPISGRNLHIFSVGREIILL